eukprot:3698138-Rhodomonas_salina.1
MIVSQCRTTRMYPGYPGTLPSPRAASLGQGPPLCISKYGYLDTRVPGYSGWCWLGTGSSVGLRPLSFCSVCTGINTKEAA